MLKVQCTFVVDDSIVTEEEFNLSKNNSEIKNILREKIIDECFREVTANHQFIKMIWVEPESNND